MAQNDALQLPEKVPPRQLPHLPTSVLRLTHEQPLLVSPALAPLADSFPPPKQVIGATGLQPFHAHSPLQLQARLHMTKEPPFYRQHALQATDHTEKDCSDDERDGLHQNVLVRRPMVSRAGGIPICRITNPTNRQVTFSKRRNGLLKKAYELSILCDVEVGAIVFSATGRLSEFASTSMPKLLERYQSYSNGLPSQKHLLQEAEFWRRQVFLLREQIFYQKDLQSYMLGENLLSLDLNDIKTVEQKIEIAIKKIKVQKAQLTQAKAEESKKREVRLKEENDVLKCKLNEVAILNALKERMLMRNEVPKVRWLGGDVMRSSMYESSLLAGEDECPSTSSTFIDQDMNNPLELQLGLELFPSKPTG